MEHHGLAFAPTGWSHALPGSAAFQALRAVRYPAWKGAHATAAQRFHDGSAIVAIGAGEARRVFPWPLVGGEDARIADEDVARLDHALARLGADPQEDLWWTNKFGDPLHARAVLHEGGLMTALVQLAQAAGLARARVRFALRSGSSPAPGGWPAVPAEFFVGHDDGTPLPDHLQAFLDSQRGPILAWLTADRMPANRAWRADSHGAWTRVLMDTLTVETSLEPGGASAHAFLEAAEALRALLAARASIPTPSS